MGSPQETALENGRPNRAAPAPVIRHMGHGEEDGGRDWLRLLPAYLISLVVHAVLLSLLLILPVFNTADAAVDTQAQVIETKVDDMESEPNLENDEIGINPDVPTNYNVDRIEEISVPGPVNPNEAVGIVGAPEGTPQTLPPPPGFGGGQGGGLDGGVGKGALFGAPGGMGGPKMGAYFGGRSGATREKMVTEGGGNTLSEAAVAGGLKWIVNHQSVDGHWGMDSFSADGKCNCGDPGRKHDISGTAFGLLPLLGAGETHKGGTKNSAYAKNVERGLKYLILKQQRDGGFTSSMYENGLASIVLCEAYGVTSDPVLKSPAQRCVDFIVAAQNAVGGWDYGKGGPTSDTSVSGWQIQALKSAQMGGLSVPKEALSKVSKYLDSYAGDTYGATYGYRAPGSSVSMTSVGLLAREYLGWGPRNPGLQKGVEQMMTANRLPDPRRKTMYTYYYATQVIHHVGGPQWETWNPKMRDLLIGEQDKGTEPGKAHQKGSWSSVGWDVGGYGGGRLMMTSLAVLTLEVYYRFLPLYRRETGSSKDPALAN